MKGIELKIPDFNSLLDAQQFEIMLDGHSIKIPTCNAVADYDLELILKLVEAYRKVHNHQ